MYYKIVSLKMWIYACEGGHILYRQFPLMHVVLDYTGYSSDYVIWFPSTFWMADYKCFLVIFNHVWNQRGKC